MRLRAVQVYDADGFRHLRLRAVQVYAARSGGYSTHDYSTNVRHALWRRT